MGSSFVSMMEVPSPEAVRSRNLPPGNSARSLPPVISPFFPFLCGFAASLAEDGRAFPLVWREMDALYACFTRLENK